MRLKLTSEDPNEWGQYDAHHVSYTRFRRRMIRRSGRDGPVVSTPLATGRQCEQSFELDTVRQKLDLDSPPTRKHREPDEPAHTVLQETITATETELEGNMSQRWRRPITETTQEQVWVWRDSVQDYDNTQQTGFKERRCDSQPFTVLDKTTLNLKGKPVMKLAAPSLLNDYYTNVLDCSCNGVIALALGSSVYLWNSETNALVGCLDPSPQTGRLHRRSISSLCWSRDGKALCIGTRRGELQLWDVENKSVRPLPSHVSMVRALSWKHHLLSSGSVLGRIHHIDPRAPAPLVGATVQKEAICSLQWSPGDDWLASGSTDGLLHIWDSDIAGTTRSKRPVTTMKQPSAVKAMGWCPWQRETIATGGGWKDGELRIWDTQSGTCVTSVNTNSQICSLRWAEKKKYLVTGHGLPHHQVLCWTWRFPSLTSVCQLTGHSHRVLHLALNPDSTRIFSAGVDQCFNIWDL